MGFLDRQSLTMIVDAPTDHDQLISTPLRNVTHNCTIQSNLSFSGRHLIKFVIAAKFNHSTSSGWPVLQIRRVHNDSFNTINVTKLEPRPTGYLNVFEYESLSAADVQQGDVVHIVPQSYGQQRYLLIYQTTPFQPQVCITWSNYSGWTEFTRTRSTIVHTCKPTTYTSEAFTNTSSESLNTTPKSSIIDKTSESPTTTISAKGRPVIAITGGVLSTLVIIILSVVLIIITFLICQRKKNAKRFSLNTNTGVSANVSSDALENVSIPDMIQAGNQMIPKPCGEGDGATIRVGTGNKVSHQNNPQEVSLLAVQ